MSLPTQVSQRRQTTKSGRITGGEGLSRADECDSELHKPEREGGQFGLVVIIGAVTRRRSYKYRKYGRDQIGHREYVHVRCTKCGETKWVNYGNIKRGIAKGCRSCLQPKQFPTWFYARLQAAESRCTDPKHTAWGRYGKRGIEFRFATPTDACLWLIENLGMPEE